MADPFFSELKYRGNRGVDAIEVAVDAGADVSDLTVTIYRQNGNIRSIIPLSGLTPSSTIAGKDVYLIDDDTTPLFEGLRRLDGVALSDSTNLYAFNSFDDGTPITPTTGPAANVTSDQIGQAGRGESLESTDGGASYGVQTSPSPGTIPCLAGGTLVRTERGDVLVDDLEPGMPIATIDGGVAPLKSVMKRHVTQDSLTQTPKLLPVRISAGALGAGFPLQDLLVSRQHRMLVSSPIVQRMFGVQEVLVAAIRLVGLPGIFVDTSVTKVTYYHLLFEQHEVIFAEGTPTESLFLGTEALYALTEEDLAEIDLIFPGLRKRGWETTPKRLIPEGKHQRKLVARHAANEKPLLASFSGT